MTDVSDDQSAYHKVLQNSDSEEADARVELQFPQILLEASFHSLLTHSVSTDRDGTVIAMPRSAEFLSESWATLSDAGSAHDEDYRSETTDAGSLIDVHNTDDVCSVQEDGQISDIDTEDEDESHAKMSQYTSTVIDEVGFDAHKHQGDSHYFHPTMTMASSMDAIILDEPQMMSRSIRGITGYHATKPLHNEQHWQHKNSSKIEPQHEHESGQPDLISMAMSKAKLDTGQRPFRVLYITSPAVPTQVKNEVLRKVGSVLVIKGMNSISDVPCYHVIPSEFGPGAKPDTSELIPVGTQMFVHEHTVQATTRPAKNMLGGSPISDNARSFRITDSEKAEILGADGIWRAPDLLLTLVSDGDGAAIRQQFIRLLSLVKHQVPTIVVRQQSGRQTGLPYLRMDPDSLHQISQVQIEEPFTVRVPVNVNILLALDSEQLNRHLQFLVEASTCAARRARTRVDTHQAPTSQWFNKMSSNMFGQFKQADDVDRQSCLFETEVTEHSAQSKRLKPCGHPERQSLIKISRAGFYITTAVLVSSFLFALCSAPFTAYSWRDLADVRSGSQTPTETLSSIPTPSPSGVSNSMNSIRPVTHEHRTDLKYTYGLDQFVQMLSPTRKTQDIRHLQDADKFQQSNGAERRRSAVSEQFADCQYKEVIRRAGWGDYLTLPDGFFGARCAVPAFEVIVARNQTVVPHRIEALGASACIIKLKTLDLHGMLDISLKSKFEDGMVCAQVDLRNSLLEVLMLYVNELHRKMQDDGTPVQSDNPEQEYAAFLELRPFTADAQTHLGQLKSRIMQAARATHDVVEKSIVGQGRACYRYSEDCIIRQSLVYRDQVVASSQLATRHAKLLADNMWDQGLKAYTRLRHSIPFVGSGSLNELIPPKKISWTVATAQKRAKQLVNRGSSAHSSHGKSNGHKHRACDFT